MSNSSNTTDAVQPFEKNRYFAAKLMTARDMLAEQEYHADRLEAVARHVLGPGVVSGLNVDTLTMDDEGLSATVPAGFAIDPSGDLIVVPESDEVEVRNASTDVPITGPGDRLAVYLRYDECSVERVPLPGSENACKQECTYNRIVESFSLVCRELSTQDEDETLLASELGLAEVSFPNLAELEKDPSSALTELEELTRIAREFTPADRTEDGETTTGDVFLGIFAKDQSGSWTRAYADLDGAFVATNELLYAAIARHTADYKNPHGTTLTVSASDDDTSQTDPPLVRVRNDEWPGGAVKFTTDGSLSITGDAKDRDDADSLDFEVVWAGIQGKEIGVESLQGDAGNKITGDVKLASDCLNITTDTSTSTPTLSLDRKDLVKTLGNAVPDGNGKIELTSDDGSIAINATNSTVDLQTTDQLGPILKADGQALEAPVALEEGQNVSLTANTTNNTVTISAVAPEPEIRDPILTETPFGRHIVERALYAKCSAFKQVEEMELTYPPREPDQRQNLIQKMLDRVNEALDPESDNSILTDERQVAVDKVLNLYIDEEEGGIVAFEELIVGAIEASNEGSREAIKGLGRFVMTVKRLNEVADNENLEKGQKVVELSMAQELVTEAAKCLEVQEE